MVKILDFRVRVPRRDSDKDPRIEISGFMKVYSERSGLNIAEGYNATSEELIREMDEAEVTKAVLHAEYEFENPHSLNDRVSKMIDKYPDRFVGFASVDPREGVIQAVHELKRAVEDMHLIGLNLQPFVYDMYPNDKKLYPLYAKCVELEVPVAIHCGINYSPFHTIDYDRPIYLDEILCDFPDLKLVALHAGWPWVGELIAIMRKHPNVYLEFGGIAPKYIGMGGKAGWDPLLQFANSLLQDRVLFGTDWPIISFKRVVEEFKELPLKEKVKEKILYRNTVRLLGLKW